MVLEPVAGDRSHSSVKFDFDAVQSRTDNLHQRRTMCGEDWQTAATENEEFRPSVFRSAIGVETRTQNSE